jgi:hypothetical protein
MIDISQIINPFPFYLDLFSFQNHRQDFSKTGGLVVSMLLVFSVFCVLFFGELTFRKVKPSRLSHCFVFNFPLLLMSRKETDFGLSFILSSFG